MKRVISSVVLAVSLSGLAVAPAYATTVSNNDHGVIKVSGCADIAAVVSGNDHGVFKIDGGNCNIEGVTISNNNHGVFKVSNVCGVVNKVIIDGNNHMNVKVTSNGACPVAPAATTTSNGGSVTITDNNHGVIKVDGSGDVTVSNNNHHGVIKVKTASTTKPSTPSTPSTPATPTTPSTPATTEVKDASTVTELPNTGSSLAPVAAAVLLIAVSAYVMARRHFRKSLVQA